MRLYFVICLGRKSSVKFWTLTTLESENCDPKRLTSRQQLAYIALRASKGLGSEISNNQTKGNEKPVDAALNQRQTDPIKEILKTQSVLDQKVYAAGTESSHISIANEVIPKVDDQRILPESLMLNDLNEIADKSVDEVDPAEAIVEILDKNQTNDPEAELQFLSHDVADFIRSTNDIQRLRSDILESERRNRLTSGY